MIAVSPKTMMWSKHSRRIDPISRSAQPFCQGEAGAAALRRKVRHPLLDAYARQVFDAHDENQ
jgi:hypothetical protein